MELKEQLSQAEEGYEREVGQKQILHSRLAELENQKGEKEETLNIKTDALAIAQAEPGRLERQIQSIENAYVDMEQDHRAVLRKIRNFEAEQEAQAKRRIEAEKLRTSILEKLELNRQTLEERERDVAAVFSNLEKAKASGHDLVTKKVELNVKQREIDGALRHLQDQQNLAQKDYELLKRQLKKKRIVANTVQQNLPGIEEQLRNQELLLRNVQDERVKKSKEIQKMKEEVDSYIAKLLQQENVEQDKKKVLD